jgi:hypothetical protein
MPFWLGQLTAAGNGRWELGVFPKLLFDSVVVIDPAGGRAWRFCVAVLGGQGPAGRGAAPNSLHTRCVCVVMCVCVCQE